MRIDRNRVGQAFNRQAVEYDRHTSIQKRVVERLLLLAGHHLERVPADVLDIGCGTGHLLSSLGRQYPVSRLYGLDLAYNMARSAAERLGSGALLVNGDAEHLPFGSGSFDLLVSSSTLQWLENLDTFFRQSYRVLKTDGLLCVAFFGGRTLCELHECFSDAAAGLRRIPGHYLDRLHRFKEVKKVQEILDRSDFGGVQLTCEIETDYYPDVSGLLHSIKRIGAGSSAQNTTGGGLGWRGILNETSRLYRERYGSAGMIPVTYEVIYVAARRCGRS